MKPYVIIGNGTAAASCIEGIRSVDRDTPITVVSEEKHPVYCRPLISYYLENKTDLQRIRYRPDDFYEANGCTVLYGVKAVRLDPGTKAVALSDGRTLAYEKLCVATGSSPFVPPMEGLDRVENKQTFLTLDDALLLEQALSPDSRVLIVGAGLIGLKCAEGILARVKSVTVCDLAGRVLSSILDDVCAARMQSHLEAQGVRFLLADTAERFDAHTAYMKSGVAVEFDRLILAVGVRANTALVRDCGGKTERGISVDERMRTSIPDVYAAGDCAQGYDISAEQSRVLAILPNANLQGRCAGINMAGGDAVFDNAIPMNAIGFFGLHLMTAGVYDGDLYEETTPDGCKKLFTKDNLLKGFILIGEQATQRAGLYTSLIRERVPLDSIDFALMRQTATVAAFSAEKRKNMFGGAQNDDR